MSLITKIINLITKSGDVDITMLEGYWDGMLAAATQDTPSAADLYMFLNQFSDQINGKMYSGPGANFRATVLQSAANAAHYASLLLPGAGSIGFGIVVEVMRLCNSTGTGTEYSSYFRPMIVAAGKPLVESGNITMRLGQIELTSGGTLVIN